MSDKKVFPVISDTACVYKWAWNTFYTYSGESASCHRIESEKISLEHFDADYHNTEKVVDDRQRMRQGLWPAAGRGCEYCKKIEDAGGVSDRIYSNNLPIANEIDFSSDITQPLISEVYINNTCDLGCVYCTAELSSKINSELITHGTNSVGEIPIVKFDKQSAYTEKYLSWVDENYTTLRRLSILGGEPLLQKEFWKLLDRAKDVKNPDLEIAINTNLNASFETIERLVVTAKQLVKNRNVKRFDIVCSLDCWGPQSEFVRYGLNLERWQKNFEYLLRHKWLYISVLQVVSSLTIKTMFDFQQIIANYKNQGHRITQEYHVVTGKVASDLYHPSAFGSEFFKQQLDEVETAHPITEPWDEETKKRIAGINKLLTSGSVLPDANRLSRLKTRLDEIDTRRGTDWKSLYPEINEFILKNVV